MLSSRQISAAFAAVQSIPRICFNNTCCMRHRASSPAVALNCSCSSSVQLKYSGLPAIKARLAAARILLVIVSVIVGSLPSIHNHSKCSTRKGAGFTRSSPLQLRPGLVLNHPCFKEVLFFAHGGLFFQPG